MIYIEPFAYKIDENIIKSNRLNRYEYLKSMGMSTYDLRINNLPGRKIYTGKIKYPDANQLTVEDIGIFLDGYTLCPFGGSGTFNNFTGEFTITIYTD